MWHMKKEDWCPFLSDGTVPLVLIQGIVERGVFNCRQVPSEETYLGYIKLKFDP